MDTRKKKDWIRRIVSSILAFVVTFSSMISETTIVAMAAEERENFTIYINEQYAAKEEQLTFDYGVTLCPTVIGTDTASMIWIPRDQYVPDSDAWNTWSDLPEKPVIGEYYVGFLDLGGSGKSELTDKYAFTIQPAQLEQPKNLTWNGLTLSWDAVNTASTTGALEENQSTDAIIDSDGLKEYQISLYQGETKVFGTTTTGTSFDFTEKITELGYGTYKAKVSAVSADPTRYTDSLDAEKEKNYKDQVAPVITSYAPGEGENTGKLVANVTDAQTGITGYAFTTKAEASLLTETDWTTVEKSTAPQSYAYAPTETGSYYFYAKDTEGNVAESAALSVTMICYHNYYENGTKQDKMQPMIGNQTVTLDTGASRPGYVMKGWYAAENCTGEALSQVASDQHKESGTIDVYEKWEKAQYQFAQTLTNLAFTYDGQARTLHADLTDAAKEEIRGAKDGSITYQWYKKQGDTFQTVSGATSSSLSVKNVSDSGVYYVQVTVSFTDDVDGAVQDTYTSNSATVSITPIALTAKVDAKEVSYLDEAPAYTVTIGGDFAEGEDRENAGIAAVYSCTYAKGNSVGSYPIGAELTADQGNYSFAVTPGYLTVKQKNVEAEDSGVTAVLADIEAIYVYDGDRHEPEITVSDGRIVGENTAVAADQYEISYADCIAAGTATATVTFKGNYTGKKTVNYSIQKADFKPTVTMESWTYDGEPRTPVTASNVSGGTTTYYYYKAGETAADATTTAPVNAGDYYVFVRIAETANYHAQDSLVDGVGTPFTISKRTITITTESGTWIYDGNTHVAPGYNVLGSFVGTDSFQSVIITGSITNVGSCDNTVQYTLTSSTLAGNYNIKEELGRLTINSTQLAAPANPGWDSDHPGRAGWVAVTRDKLEVTYRVQLYRMVESESGTQYEPVGDPKEVTTTYVDYLDIIKNDCETKGSAQCYAFDVVALPSGGAAKGNYTISNATAKSEGMGTVLVSVAGDSGIESVTINGQSGPVYLVEDETATVAATAKTGYALAEKVWTTTATGLTISNAKKDTTTIQVGSIPCQVGNCAQLTANSVDKSPVITQFTAVPQDNNSKVLFSFGATDELNITGWMINQSADAPSADAEGWVSVNDTSILVNMDQGSNVASAKGTYYLWVKDSNNTVVGAKNPIQVYEIQFAAGGGTGTMDPMLKVQNMDLTLPEMTFTKAGYYFKNWSGTTGIYVNRGAYVANKDDTLTATWTDQAFSYKVQYYYMNTDGTYGEACESEAVFSAHYGETIAAGKEEIQASKTGFAIDTEMFQTQNGGESVTIHAENQVVKLYYQRQKYTLTYAYVIPSSGATESFSSDVRYGASVTEREKPSIPGYDFVGWTYGESGSKPDTMPNKNITATGYFVAKEAEYVINYYGQNVDCGNTYTLLTEYTEIKKCLHDDVIIYGKADARELTGYTVQGVVVSRGAASGADISALTVKESCTEPASAVESEKLYINVYLTRNLHSITLNVWKGSRDVPSNSVYRMTWENIPYGYAFTSEEIAEYATYYETHAKDAYESDESKGLSGYTLASYTDWSTGGCPVFMPDGDVTLSKDYVVASDSRYYVEIFAEGTNGTYSKLANMVCYSSVGRIISYNPDSSAMDPADAYITYEELKNNMPSLEHYQYNARLSDPAAEGYTPDANGPGCISGTVTDENDPEKEPLTLRIYFERKTVTTSIRYYYANESTGNTVKMYTVTKTGKWGTKYSIEADAYFDSNTDARESADDTYWSDKTQGTVTAVTPDAVTIEGVDGNLYDFRNNTYAVSYDERHIENGHYTYSSKTYLQASDFTGDETAVFGYDSASNYVNVYYVKVDTAKTYYVDVKYRTGGLHAVGSGNSQDIPLTYKIGETTYKVRLANEKDLFTGTVGEAAEETAYPAGAALRQMRTPLSTEDKTLKAGYTAVSVTTAYGTDTYYTTEDGYIYIVDTRNHLFYGNRASVNLGNPTGYSSGINNTASIGYQDIVDYLTAYKADEENGDSARDAAYIYNNGMGSMLYSTGDHYTYVYTFAYTETYSLTFSLNGDTRTNEQRYVYGKTFTPEEMEAFANGHFSCPIGKRIALYQDAQCTVPVDANYVIKGNSMIYCRYEKAIYDNCYFISYELPNPVTLDEEEIYYVDKTNYEAVLAADVFDADPVVQMEDMTLTNEYDIALTRQKVTTTYSIDGEPALVLVKVPGFANSEVSMAYGAYAKAGYYYDETNSNNTSNGYCMTEGVRLAAYYSRYKYTFTLDNNNAKINNATVYTYSYGRNVVLETPEKEGYTFAGWKWTFGESDLHWASNITSFVMPTQNVTAVAQWTPAAFTGKITHYFQTETETYDTAGLAAMLDTQGEEQQDVTIRLHNDLIAAPELSDGKLYSRDASVIGASVSYDGNVYYFDAATAKAGYYEVDASDLIAMISTMTETSEDSVAVSKYQMPSDGPFASIFGYAFTICSEGAAIQRYDSTDSFAASAQMDVAYYYTRSSNNQIRAIALSTDGGVAGVTLTGTGDHFYGQNATLSAALSLGYDFVGWYRAEDVLVRYDEASNKITYSEDLAGNVSMELSDYTLDPTYDLEQALGTDKTYSFKVTRPDAYVAVVAPLAIEGTTAEITCDSENITYGSIDPAQDALSLKIVLGNDNVVVSGYQWYIQDGEDWKVIEGATSSSYNLPADSAAGTYTYKCKVTFGRSDNGRTFTMETAPYAITIQKAQMKVKSADYQGIYDGLNHGITLEIEKPVSNTDYVIYYSDTEITSETDLNTLSTESFIRKDVKYNEESKSVESYDVYFCIHDKTGNYQDYIGHNTILIKPKTITVKASTLGYSYSKVYDKDTVVHGEIEDVDSDKGRLANGLNGKTFYTITGIVASDQAMENTSYIIDFNAEYNYAHVDTATAVTLKNMKLVTVANGVYTDNHNYNFIASTTLTLSAYITPYPIQTNWEDTATYTYDGNAHIPSVTIGDREKIPDGYENIVLNTSGEQVNVGDYYASVTIGIKEDVADIYSSDYKAATEKKEYHIVKRDLTITPSNASEDINKVYNGQEQTIVNFSKTGLVEGQEVTYVPNTSRKDAGTVQIKADQVKVFAMDSEGNKKNVTDNYNIICPEQTLTIEKKPVTFSGITAENKTYDGTTKAVLDMDEVQISNVLEGDTIHLVESNLNGNFESPAVGDYTDKVTISIAEGKDVEDLLDGEDAKNYIVDWSSADTQKKTSASITGAQILVKVKDVTEVYGETPAFAVEYSAFKNGEDQSVITGTPVYKVRLQGTDGDFVTYSPTMGVGTYEIAVDISGLSAGNYTLAVENPTASDSRVGETNFLRTTATLTVEKRPVVASKTSDTAVSKTYNGNDIADKSEALTRVTLIAEAGNAKSGVVVGDTVTLGTNSAVYNSKDVAAANTVTLSGLTLTQGSSNYKLVNSTVDVVGEITKQPLTITAKSQTITYGDAASAFSAEFDGLVAGETIAASNLKFTCDYDTTDSAKRNVGDHDITVAYADDYSNGNYAVTFEKGKVTVEKKEVKVNGESYQVIYNLGTIPTYGLKDSEPYTGFVYGETIETLDGKTSSGDITFSCKDSANQDVTNVSLPKGYTIQMDLHGLEATNYTFTAVPGTLTIVKRELTIDGIKVGAKVYDGTLHLAELSQISYNDITYGSQILAADKTYVTDHDLICVQVTNALTDDVYNDKNVGTDKTVTLKIKLTGYLAERYTLTSDTVTVSGCVITKKDLTVKANNKTISYGSAVPSYTVSYDGLVGGETKDVLGGTLAFACGYTDTSDVGTYTITPSGYDSGNYNIGYTDGTLTVGPATMTAKAPCWDTTRPGTAIWQQADTIGNVSPDHYTLQLYKDGTAVTIYKDGAAQGTEITVNAAGTLEYDFAETIRTNGAGLYTVGLKVTPSLVNNAGNKNVTAGGEVKSTASEIVAGRKLRAAKVNVIMAADTTSQAGVEGVTQPVYIQAAGTTEYIIIAGESSVALGVTMKNATGYRVKTIAVTTETANNTAADYFTIAAGTQTDKTYGTTVDAKQNLTDSAITAATFMVTLEAVKPTLTLGIEQINNNYIPESFAYGYTEEMAPKYRVNPAVAMQDNVTTDGYIYTYQWEYKVLGGAYTTPDTGSTASTLKWQTGFTVNQYIIKCTVTAQRKDNGLTTQGSSTVNLAIPRTDLQSEVRINGWDYGQSRIEPYVTFNPEAGAVTYYYCKVTDSVDGTYTTSKPTEAGNYKVKAVIAQTANYNEKTTEPVAFTIDRVRFAEAANFTMSNSPTAPYGLFQWDAVSVIQENAGVTSASSVAPKYALLFVKQTTETSGAVALTDIDSSLSQGTRISYGDKYYDVIAVKAGDDCVTACQYDFTSCIQDAGVYSLFVQVYPGAYTGSTAAEFGSCSGERNVEESGLSMYAENLEFKGSIEVKHDGADVVKQSDGSVALTYDGLVTTLEMKYSLGETDAVTYQWYKNGVAVPNSNTKILTLKNVADTGGYTCAVSWNGVQQVLSPCQVITINQRKLTIQAASQTRTYNGTELKNSGYTATNTASDEGLATAAEIDDEITACTVTGSQTNVGNSDNVPSAAKIQVGTNGEDVTANYDITYKKGTLTVDPDTATFKITSTSINKTYDGTPMENPAVSYTGVNGVDLRTETNVTFTYYKKNVDNTYSVIVGAPKDAGDYKVVAHGATVANYKEVTDQELTFTISLREITIQAKDDNKDYDGTALTNSGYDVTNTQAGQGLATGDKITACTVTGSQTNVGNSANTPSNAVIKVIADGEDVTGNYHITYANGTLTVDEAEAAFSITDTSESVGKIYDGTAVADPAVSYTGVNSENLKTASNITFTYYPRIAEGVGGAEDTYGAALPGAPKNAGTYKVVAHAQKASNYKTVDDVELIFTISRRQITIQAKSDTKTYNGTALTKDDYTFTATSTGVGLATAAEIDDKITYVKISGSQTNVGNSNNVPSAAKIQVGSTSGEDVTANYDIDYQNGTLTVTPATASFHITTGIPDKIYDGTTVADPEVSYTGVGGADLKTATNVTFTYYKKIADGAPGEEDVYSSEALSGAPKNAGTYKVVACADQVDNYYGVAEKVLTFTISQRNITIQAASDEKVYTGTALTNAGYEATNTAANEGLAEPTGGTADVITACTVSGSQTDVGSSNNEPSAAKIQVGNVNGEDVTGNYHIDYQNGMLTVTEATASFRITATTMDQPYDGAPVADPAVAYTGVGGINLNTGDNVTFTYYKKGTDGFYGSALTGAPKDVGDYKVVAHGATVANYNPVDNQELTFTISQRNITIQAASDSKPYDGTPLTNDLCEITNTAPEEGLATAGTIPDQLTEISISGSQTAVGTSDNIADAARIRVGSDGEDVTANYHITYEKGTLEVTRAEVSLTILADTMDKRYDGVEVADPEISCTGLGGIDLLENPEGASEVTFTYYVKGTDSRYEAIAGAPRKAGEYKLVVSTRDGEIYEACEAELPFIISPRPITIRSGDAEKIYDGAALTEDSYTVINTESNEGLAAPTGREADVITACTITGSQIDAGSSANTIDGVVIRTGDAEGEDVTESYQVTLVPGTLQVNQKTFMEDDGSSPDDEQEEGENPSGGTSQKKISIEVGDAGSTIYMGVELTPDIKVSYCGRELVEGIDYQIEYYDNIDEGVAYVKVLGIHNFSGTITRKFDIVKRKIVIQTESSSKAYDGTPLTCDQYTVSKYFDETTQQYIEKSGLAENHTAVVTVSGSRTEVGTTENAVESVKILDAAGADVTANYEISYKLGTLEVTEAKEQEPTEQDPAQDQQVPQQPEAYIESKNRENSQIPTTEDNSNILLYWILSILSGSILVLGRRKKEKSDE